MWAQGLCTAALDFKLFRVHGLHIGYTLQCDASSRVYPTALSSGSSKTIAESFISWTCYLFGSGLFDFCRYHTMSLQSITVIVVVIASSVNVFILASSVITDTI